MLERESMMRSRALEAHQKDKKVSGEGPNKGRRGGGSTAGVNRSNNFGAPPPPPKFVTQFGKATASCHTAKEKLQWAHQAMEASQGSDASGVHAHEKRILAEIRNERQRQKAITDAGGPPPFVSSFPNPTNNQTLRMGVYRDQANFHGSSTYAGSTKTAVYQFRSDSLIKEMGYPDFHRYFGFNKLAEDRKRIYLQERISKITPSSMPLHEVHRPDPPFRGAC